MFYNLKKLHRHHASLSLIRLVEKKDRKNAYYNVNKISIVFPSVSALIPLFDVFL
jgi:predicted metalloendopeptidase